MPLAKPARPELLRQVAKCNLILGLALSAGHLDVAALLVLLE